METLLSSVQFNESQSSSQNQNVVASTDSSQQSIFRVIRNVKMHQKSVLVFYNILNFILGMLFCKNYNLLLLLFWTGSGTGHEEVEQQEQVHV